MVFSAPKFVVRVLIRFVDVIAEDYIILEKWFPLKSERVHSL